MLVVGSSSELPVLWPFMLTDGFCIGLPISTLAPGAARGPCPPLPVPIWEWKVLYGALLFHRHVIIAHVLWDLCAWSFRGACLKVTCRVERRLASSVEMDQKHLTVLLW